jgi:hypothetical protein
LAFKAKCRLSANQDLARLKLSLSMCKENLKLNKKSKQTMLKLKDVKCKETNSLYQKNMTMNIKLCDQIEVLHKKFNTQGNSVSTLNGDLISDGKDSGERRTQEGEQDVEVQAWNIGEEIGKLLAYDKQKMLHALQLK